jgi:Cof subfamily protein (haloacid dehalogenase superfamily)
MTNVQARRILALDVDRTLLTDDYRLLPQVRDAVQGVRRSGAIVALTTARGPVALELVLKDLGDIDYAICFGGALILHRERSAWAPVPDTVSMTLDDDARETLVSLCRQLGLSVAAYSMDTVYVDEMDSQLRREFCHTGDQYEIRRLSDVSEPLFKFLVISKLDEVDKLVCVRAQLSPQFSCAMSHLNYLEVGPRDVSKGDGLASLAKSIGVDRQRTVAIGDGENDLSMLAWAGLSIAMGNASQQVRDAADWTTASNAEAGVAVAINKLTEMTWHAGASAEQLEKNS